MWPFKIKKKQKKEFQHKEKNGFYDTDKKMSVVYSQKSYAIQNQLDKMSAARRALGAW